MFKRVRNSIIVAATLLSLGLVAVVARAQAPEAESPNSQDQATQPHTGSMPIYRVTVVARTISAINYRHHSGSTTVDFQGTSLMPEGQGHANVESRQGAIHVDADFKHLRPPSSYGPEYMTYVLWAISPEGRPVNLGELLVNNAGKSRLTVTSDLQSF